MNEVREHFADRLIGAVRRCNTPLVVGIDPHLELLPPPFDRDVSRGDFSAIARHVSTFSKAVIDVVAGLVPAVKPQAAFFEALGAPGMVALAEVIDHARDRGLLVVLDAKRGDIGSTAEAYAKAWLGPKPESAWGCDALTVNPWLGDDSLQPFVKRARATGSGLFILVKTSNPGSRTFQELASGDQPLYRHVGEWVQSVARETVGKSGYGIAGAVVGATHPQQLAELRRTMPNTLFLVPGYGAQGAGAADVIGAFDARGEGAIINSSRAILFASRQPRYASARTWESAVEAAARDTIEELASVLPRSAKPR
jgi:orotidine-5'-phosphate decarboxylase